MTDNNQLFELMTKMYGEMQEGFKKVEDRMESMEVNIKDLKEGQERIENKIDNLESHNAERHMIINAEVRKIKSTLSKVEMVTADNWSDIARLKSHRRTK